MAVGSEISLADGKLMVNGGSCILSDVHDNIILSPAESQVNGTFIGVLSDHHGSRRVFPVGKLEGLRFMSLYRFKLWWMIQRMGQYGKDIPVETQFLMVEASNSHLREGAEDCEDQSVLYTVFLPVLEGDFRAVLQGNADNELEICLESGDPAVQEFEGKLLLFVAAGTNPYRLIESAIKCLEEHLQTFHHRERKKMPDILNWFGWCTWDAFYTDVTEEGVNRGLESLGRGGTPPKFIIIDDGWQSVAMDPSSVEYKFCNTANFSNRLTDIKENNKFRKDGKEGHRLDDPPTGLRQILKEIKDRHAVKYVYMWHAITGYWGGVNPGSAVMEKFDPKIIDPIASPGIQSNAICFVLESIIQNKFGIVHPEKVHIFFNELHSYLASTGVDGVKVDVQCILETFGAGYRGRVELARKYHQAMEASILRNFPDNGLISCMCHNTDTLYCAKNAAIIRASDDFFPNDTASHTIHIASVAYNTLFIGEFMQPDWDMFHSLHPMAEYHAAARAVGGCAIYVSDKPGCHDFDLLKKLVLPDGSTLRAKLPGRPTRDCLFSDPTSDGKSLLKIWNLNDFNGVVGAFNCQGAAWCRVQKTNRIYKKHPNTITGFLRAKDVDHLSSVADVTWTGDSIIYSHRKGDVVSLSKNASLEIQLKPREYEVFTVAPVKQLSNGASFAPIGLIKMFNSGGAIKELMYESETIGTVTMRVRGCGVFGVYSSIRPRKVVVDKEEINFLYDQDSGLLSLTLRIPKKELHIWDITMEL